ncbi:MAG: sulfotransferase, partial [Bdellovibrionia bacterium]
MREFAFQLERGLSRARPLVAKDGEHIFVAGLARSGTTVLMRALFDSGEFASLTYRDMPLVMAPGLWSRLTGAFQTSMKPEERAHGDGILVDHDSPEALEEVFWRTFVGDRYLRPDRLLVHSVDGERLADFTDYVGLILRRYGRARYLSKNNNNVLRLPSLLGNFPNAKVLIPFRKPLQQAYSLREQDRRFLDVHRSDPFALSYMTWLGHHEFGGDHRPFQWSEELLGLARDGLDYWLMQWIETYSRLLSVGRGNSRVRFVCYEKLCENSAREFTQIEQFAGLTRGPVP